MKGPIDTLRDRLVALEQVMPKPVEHVKDFKPGMLVYTQYKHEVMVVNVDAYQLTIMYPKAGTTCDYTYLPDSQSFRLKASTSGPLQTERFYATSELAELAFKRIYVAFDIKFITRKIDSLIKSLK